MSVEDKLDEDFLFYLGFTSGVMQKLKECDKPKAQQWLQKLCGEACSTISQKRNRNIFLSNLLLDLQEKQLSGPFTQNPDDINFDDAASYFPALTTEIITPAWVEELNEATPAADENDGSPDGRTYVATRAMPGGEGAFAYVAVNMSDEPLWFGGGEGAFDNAMQEKFKEYVPPQTEMEVILSRRKDPHERQRVITFYEVILQNIGDELDGKITTQENTIVDGLMDQLIKDLQRRNEYAQYALMPDKERRVELLLLLFDLTYRRKRQTQTREEVLDNIGAELEQSFFEASGIAEENKYELPCAMWEYCINKPPTKKAITTLKETYPPFLVEIFLQLMANMKEEIAMRMQRRHVNIISQMKQELNTESVKLKKRVDDIKQESDQMEAVLKAVRAAREKQAKSYEEANKRKKGGETKLTGAYEEMKAALQETQLGVEQESERGHMLAEQINALNAQTEMYNEISERTIMMTEETNMELMKNIKRMTATVKMHEGRLNQIMKMQQTDEKPGGAQQMFIV